MPAQGNGVIPNGHFHKDWQKMVKCWFNQPARKRRRAQKRLQKAARVAPRPVKGALRPVVRCSTQRYSRRTRSGRGFSLEELKALGVGRSEARSIGIAVDHRRKNRSLEALQENVYRLKEYKSRLILFPKKLNVPKKNDSTAEELKMAEQLTGVVMPVQNAVRKEKARALTANEKKSSAVVALRQAKADQRLRGFRQKKARDAANEPIGGAKK